MRTLTALLGIAVTACLLVACGGRDRHSDAGFDAGPVVHSGPITFRTCDPVQFDAGPPPDLGPPQVCFGSPTMDCSTYTTTTCPSSLGCVVTQCRGFPISCGSISTMSECAGEAGCTWTGTACNGTANACNTFTAMDPCSHQAGCVWSATMSCGGLTTQCAALSAGTCATQPGCTTTNPDAGVMVDAGLVGCTACAGSAPVDLRVVKGPEPLTPVAGAQVHFESTCGPAMDLTTGADGSLHVDLDRTMGAWTMTVASTGLTAVSVVGVSEIEFDGDVRLDPPTTPTPMDIGAVGIVSGATSGGDTLVVDGYDFATTMAGSGGTWTSTFQLNSWPVPLRFCATELNGSGDAVNLVCGDSLMRSNMPVSGVTLAFPAGVTPTTSNISIDLPAGGVLAAGSTTLASAPLATNTVAYQNDPAMLVGSATYDDATHVLRVISFPDMLPVNQVDLQLMSATHFLTAHVYDVSATNVAVPQLDALTVNGASLGDATIGGGGTGWDALGFYIGVQDSSGAAITPAWRIYVPLNGGTAIAAEVPHLPHSVTPASLGLAAPTSAFGVALKMHGNRPWSTRSTDFSPRDVELSIGAQPVMLDITGR